MAKTEKEILSNGGNKTELNSGILNISISQYLNINHGNIAKNTLHDKNYILVNAEQASINVKLCCQTKQLKQPSK